MRLKVIFISLMVFYFQSSQFAYCHDWNIKDSIIVHVDTTSIICEDYIFFVRSEYIKDSLDQNEAQSFYPMILEQVVVIIKKGKIIYQKPHPVNKILLQSANSGPILMQENKIQQIGVVRGNGKCFFTISGYGGCISCTEFSAILNSEGKMIWCYYGDRFKTIIYKGRRRIFFRNGINEQEHRAGKYPTVYVLDAFYRENGY